MTSENNTSKWQKGSFENGILEVMTQSWQGFVSFIQDEFRDYQHYIFRGQREPEWKLVPSFYRNNALSLDSNRALKDFKMASRGRRGPFPHNLNDDEWWTLGQHHGLQTPLLDWTESPFVAAFFAFSTERKKEDLPKSRVIYALSKSSVIDKSDQIKKSNPGTVLTDTDAIEILTPQTDENGRLVSQRGLFTKSLSPYLDIEDWTRRNFDNSQGAVLIKIFIHESENEREKFLVFLNRMNINYLSLFPDLEGATLHCNMQRKIRNY